MFNTLAFSFNKVGNLTSQIETYRTNVYFKGIDMLADLVSAVRGLWYNTWKSYSAYKNIKYNFSIEAKFTSK